MTEPYELSYEVTDLIRVIRFNSCNSFNEQSPYQNSPLCALLVD